MALTDYEYLSAGDDFSPKDLYLLSIVAKPWGQINKSYIIGGWIGKASKQQQAASRPSFLIIIS